MTSFLAIVLASASALAAAGTPVTVAPAAAAAPGFDVLAFGAKGDGKTDDTAAIQRAVDAAVAAGGGEVVIPGNGRTYVVRASQPTMQHPTRIRITGRGVHVRGVGMPVFRMEGLDKAYLESIDDHLSSGRDLFTVFSFVLATDCSIRGIRFEGPWDGVGTFRYKSPRAKAVGFTGCTRCTAEDLSGTGILGNLVNATPADRAFEGDYRPNSGIRVHNCHAERCLENGFNFMGNTFEGSISDSTATLCGSTGFEAATDGLVVSGNRFERNKSAGMSLSGTRIVATGNVLLANGGKEHVAGSGVMIAGGSDILLASNLIAQNDGFGVHVYPGVRRLSIIGNHLADNSSKREYRFGVYAVGVEGRRIDELRVAMNVMVDEIGAADAFLNANNTDRLEVTANSVRMRDGAAAAIQVQRGSRDSVVHDNTVNKPVVVDPAAGASYRNGEAGTTRGGTATPTGVRAEITRDVEPIAAGRCAADVAISVRGAAPRAECVVGLPASIGPGIQGTCYVAAADEVRLRLCNHGGAPADPPPATYSVRVFNP